MISSRHGVAVLALVPALALTPAAVGLADGGNSSGSDSNGSGSGSASETRPDVLTQPPILVGVDRATLKGKLRTPAATTYWFEYGTTTEYGQSTTAVPVEADASNSWVSVAKQIEGLAPSTTYHFRVVVADGDGTVAGSDKSFMTANADGTSNGHGGGAGSDKSETAQPEFGRSVVVEPADGVIRVRRPKDKGFGPLEPGVGVPTGTVIDASRGKISLTTSVTENTTQTATFWGGVFEVRQARDGRGYTDLYLRGPSLAKCPAPGQAASSAKRRSRSLWGKDRRGRYRTHGRNSVATVRGTTWLTTEKCAGTVTFVRDGAVAVRDRHRKRTVLVRAGHAYLARPHR
jgi:hypothetical protein